MAETAKTGTRAVVLGGGGVAGIAWEIGLLAELLDRGIPLNDADFVVGTSAGSVVGALLRFDSIGDALAEQLIPIEDQPTAGNSFDSTDFMADLKAATQEATSDQDARARLGVVARAVTADTPEDERIAAMAGRFPSAEWPPKRLGVTAIDVTDGSFRVFDAGSGVELARAISASCAVPGVWPPIAIEGHSFMDGGIRSGTNADVAAGYDKILVIACFPEAPLSPLGMTLPQAVEILEADSRVLVVTANEASMAAFGTNPLAMSSRSPSARAGQRQAADVAEAVSDFWNGGH
jgi:NTE family protein